ncbi:MAG: PSD1 and planctomycete cytochrome C domain-containing protein [Planctomycetota bacterium]|nr:PSD1 and planctomycete cytochrome C domain-containing protein [Planctomycetota bacterium]
MPARPRLLAALAVAVVTGSASAQDVSFSRDVLPILSDRCFQCHGPDERARKAELRLDVREDLLRPRDGYAIVTPGAPEQSELIARITSEGDDVMPPRHTKLDVTDAEVDVLRRWIAAGAEWSTHWAFRPNQAPAPPPVRDRAWPRNDVDRFVLARLEGAAITPNAPAAPAALLRRVHLDLTGLPPTPAQLAAFVADPSDARYQAVVDALLASPRYGERMAWPWLEAARYADTDGFQNDPTRTAWPWRDWLVRALNDNLPFDQFTEQVLAGDLLPDATDEQRLATGFLRNNAHNGEGGRIPEETRVENVFDRAETVGTVWLGMTFECARCHDHKYDPLPQRDYYRFYAFFNQTSETGGGRSGGRLAPSMGFLADPDERRALADKQLEVATIHQLMFRPDPELDSREQAWIKAAAARLRAANAGFAAAELSAWRQSEPFRAAAVAMFDEAFAPEQGAAEAAGWRPAPGFVDGAVYGLPDGAYVTYFAREISAPSARRMTVSLGSDDAIKVWCNGELVLANDVRRGAKPDQERVELQLRSGRNDLLVKIVNTGGIGGAYFRVVDETIGDLPADVARALLQPPIQRRDEHRRALRAHFRREHQPAFAERERLLDARQREIAALESKRLTVSVMDALPAAKRRATRVLARGDYQAPGDAVTAGTPAFLPPLKGDGEPDRLDLARWLTSGDHPLVARVAANRAWQTFFGRGFVATSENFGRQGERPTHPALLDWLARRFVESGWDLKGLHRLIVTSATYRQAASAPTARFEDDPENRLLARSPRRRLPAWMLRDQALALSGNLAPQVGGPPVRPYQPAGVWDEATFGFIKYRQGSGEELRRRSLYTFWRRIVGPTMLFDTPARQQCVVRHATTNTPLHALTTLNETGYVEAARGFAARALRADGDPAAQLRWLFAAATARRPEAAELEVLTRRFAAAKARFAAGDLDRGAFLQVGADQPGADLDQDDLAAMTVVASLVLNLDEVLCRP